MLRLYLRLPNIIHGDLVLMVVYYLSDVLNIV